MITSRIDLDGSARPTNTAKLHNVAVEENAQRIDFSLANLPDTLDDNWVTDDEDSDMQDYSDDDTNED